MDLLKDLKAALLNFSFIMIYTIHKVLVLIKNHLNYLKDNIFKYFFKEYNIPLFKKKKNFSYYIIIKSLSLEEENIIKDIRSLYTLKKDKNLDKKKKLRQLKIEY